ncbi:hypothetical protein BDV25DRAFT_136110 [Aspergillus avenaceus]|uniref:Uncharacterized protein n=1 Tax=Aspergillus avenaceus TaxID=36643 RepID=A0A5N6U6I6_ASPAV|nr:hypothetical protein BDV25DRAFT_136110 [Aspergillus avenaceus]
MSDRRNNSPPPYRPVVANHSNNGRPMGLAATPQSNNTANPHLRLPPPSPAQAYPSPPLLPRQVQSLGVLNKPIQLPAINPATNQVTNQANNHATNGEPSNGFPARRVPPGLKRGLPSRTSGKKTSVSLSQMLDGGDIAGLPGSLLDLRRKKLKTHAEVHRTRARALEIDLMVVDMDEKLEMDRWVRDQEQGEN